MADTNLAETAPTTPAHAPTAAAARAIAERNRNPLLALRDEFDRLFDETFSMFPMPWARRAPLDVEPLLRFGEDGMAFAPPADVDEREEDYRVIMEMPGMDETTTEISVQGDLLCIRAEKTERTNEKDATRTFSERRYGVCGRTFRLPENVARDRIAATMKNGVLTVTLPKITPARPGGRKIEIAKE